MLPKFKILGAEMYIFIQFYIVNRYHTKSTIFHTKKHKCDTDIRQQFNKQEVNINIPMF